MYTWKLHLTWTLQKHTWNACKTNPIANKLQIILILEFGIYTCINDFKQQNAKGNERFSRNIQNIEISILKWANTICIMHNGWKKEEEEEIK